MTKIITDEDKLIARAKEVNTVTENKNIRKVISRLKVAIRENNICALSAPCIGENMRIICLALDGETKIQSYINPVITESTGITLSKETCSCIPEKTFIIPRNTEIKVMYQTPLGNVETKKFKGIAAIIFQHQLQHLDGILLTDFGLEIEEDFEKASEEEQNEVLAAYMDSLDLLETAINDNINTDELSKQTLEAIDFITQAQTGKVQLTDIK